MSGGVQLEICGDGKEEGLFLMRSKVSKPQDHGFTETKLSSKIIQLFILSDGSLAS